VETPSADILRELQTVADEQAKLNNPKPAVNAKNKAPVKPTNVVEEAALKSVVKQVYVTGDYAGLVAFMKMLESYQRIVGVSQVVVAVKAMTRRVCAMRPLSGPERLKLKQPLLSFLLTLYYLP